MTQCEVVHIVWLVAFQHVGLQQRIFGYARKRDAVVGEDVLIVFEVLPELFVRCTFKPGFEFLQSVFAIQVIRCAGIMVCERQIGGMVCLDGERHADQLRIQRIETGRFGVHANEVGLRKFFQPGIELGVGENGFVFTG